MRRQRPLDPPDEFAVLRAQDVLHRMTYPDGHEGWLVTGYGAARAILADNRFSNRPELQHQPIPARAEFVKQVKDVRRQPGMFLRMDPPDHTRFRKLLTGQFTVRRMKMLEPRIAEITEDRLAAMTPPSDLVKDFALPIPSLVICELLGVPYEDRKTFQSASERMLALESDPGVLMGAFQELAGYLDELIARKRAEPDDALLSGLLDLENDELIGVALLLLVAGHETTANMIGLGTFTLLTNPGQLALMRDDPSTVDSGVEELLRYLSIIHAGPVRAALEDVEIDGHVIKAGESVMISIPSANRDSGQFSAPDTLDVTRKAGHHLSFGHGIHQCLGQQLARIEMRIALPALLRRFPTLRLACEPSEVPMRSDMAIYGVHSLPVTW
ncbi:cytochrome P450 [Nonomuraea typhae]|uniref:cytochrome P450 n=1 Tax=Nonomuraea typhae TaxID=2603600 RepID=UPI001FE7C7B7|nr:cytochrome P450 [Nonomuraea typhae]